MDKAAVEPGSTVLVGLVGKAIQMSRSPLMHEAEGRRHGLNYVYTLLDTERMRPKPPELGEILRFAELFGYRGLNITHPYKQAVLPYLDDLSENAAVVGSVNTVVFRNDRSVGHNTDLWGFAESFRRRMAGQPRKNVLLLGAGGAGAAVAHALLENGVERLRIYDIDQARAEELVARLSQRDGIDRASVSRDIAEDARTADGLVNATPVGMSSMPGLPIDVDLLRRSMWVADIVYFPLETELLKAARKKSCRVMDGADMAVFQAARAFEHFTGLSPNVEQMSADFRAHHGSSVG